MDDSPLKACIFNGPSVADLPALRKDYDIIYNTSYMLYRKRKAHTVDGFT